jgi:hypothetical protein
MNKFARVIRSARAQYVAPILGAGVLALATSSHAVIDITAATTGVADAQTAVLGVLAAMITMAAAIFGVRKVLHLLGGH